MSQGSEWHAWLAWVVGAAPLVLLCLFTLGDALIEDHRLALAAGPLRPVPPASDVRCAACASSELAMEGPGRYTCRRCGYAGGSRRGELDAAHRAHAWAARPLAERITAAGEDLDAAGALLDVLEAAVRERLVREHTTLRGLLRNAPLPGEVVLRPRRPRRRGPRFRSVLLEVENGLDEVVEAIAAAAEKLPALGVPQAPVLTDPPYDVGKKWAQIRKAVAALRETLARDRSLLALWARDPAAGPPVR